MFVGGAIMIHSALREWIGKHVVDFPGIMLQSNRELKVFLGDRVPVLIDVS